MGINLSEGEEMEEKNGEVSSKEKWRGAGVEEDDICREDPLVAVRNTNRDQRFLTTLH